MCPHDISAREVAVADGYCPLCMAESIEYNRRLRAHLSHCNFGEQPGQCKYGDEDCPALTENWKWMGDAISKSENKDRTIARLRQRIIELEEELDSKCV